MRLRALALFVSLATAAEGQGRPATIRVEVADSVNAPVAGADVTIVRGLAITIAAGSSDAAGVFIARTGNTEETVEVVVRRLGHLPARRLVLARPGDTARVRLTLRRTPAYLDTVRVTAEQSVKRARTFVDADAIAASARPLVDAWDVVNKLRPDMTLEPPDFSGQCSPAHIWVNGSRITNPPPNPMAQALKGDTLLKSPASRIPAHILSVLLSIKPEHIDGITYNDCATTVVEDKAYVTSAFFVTLKDGVRFEPGLGSIVVGAEEQDKLRRSITRAPAPAEPERYRLRLVGVFDVESGAPIDSTDVIEVGTGSKVHTSATGSAILAFMRPEGGLLLFRKDGYRSDTLTVKLSPMDTSPITVLLRKVK